MRERGGLASMRRQIRPEGEIDPLVFDARHDLLLQFLGHGRQAIRGRPAHLVHISDTSAAISSDSGVSRLFGARC